VFHATTPRRNEKDQKKTLDEVLINSREDLHHNLLACASGLEQTQKLLVASLRRCVKQVFGLPFTWVDFSCAA
jgi:hypothetical protein